MNLTNKTNTKGGSRFSFPLKLMSTLVLLFSLFQTASAQQHVTMQFTNCAAVGNNRYEFDVIVTNDGTVPIKFNSVVIRWNYGNAPVLSAGTHSWGNVSTTMGTGWGASGTYTHSAGTRLCSFSSGTGFWTSAAVAPDLPIGTPITLGRYYFQTSTSFTQGVLNQATWATTAGIVGWVNGSPTTSSLNTTTTRTLVAPCSIPLNVPSNTCPTSAVASNVVDPSCFGGTGSADITLDPVPAPTVGGTYTVDGGAAVAYTANPFNVAGLSQGQHTIAVTNTNCTTPVEAIVMIGGPSSSPDFTDNIPDQCGSYTWPVNGLTYTTTQVGTTASTTVGGCPATATLNVVINPDPSYVDNQPAQCGSYTWPVNGVTYTATQVGTTSPITVNGCMGTATLNVVINQPTTNTSTESACSSYTWPVTGLTYTTTGVYPGPTVNCVTEELNLTILGGHMVLASAGNAASTTGTSTATGTLSNNTVLFESGCDYAAEIADGPSGVGAGATSVTVMVDGSNPIGPNGQVYAPRHFSVSAVNDESGSVVLYATQDDFDDYNANNGSLLDMDASSVKIAQAIGGLSGTVNTVSSSATWNAALSRYEISGDLTSLNGDLYLYTDAACSLTMGAITATQGTPNSTWDLTWAAVPGAANYEIRFRVVGSTTWNMTTTTGLLKAINGCLPATTYEFQGKVRCSSAASGLWGAMGSFTTAASPCQPATNLAAGNITPSAATITWDAMPGASSYVLRFRPVTNPVSSWTGVGGNTGTMRLLQGLASGTAYEVQIATFCTSTNSLSAFGPMPAVEFTTLANPCTAPVNIAATATTTTASLTWDAVPAASSYVLRYSTTATGPWINSGCPTNSKVLANLTANTTYYVEIKTSCASINTQSGWSAYNFTTGVQLRPSEEPVNSLTEASSAFNIYPNPTTDMMTVELTAATAQTTTVKVYDLTGRLMKQVVSQTEAGTQKVEVSLGEIATGVYTVQVYENEKLTHISRVRKND
jgi:hypothetical protein